MIKIFIDLYCKIVIMVKTAYFLVCSVVVIVENIDLDI